MLWPQTREEAGERVGGVQAAAPSRNATSAKIMTAVLRTSRKSFGIIKLSSLAPDEQPGHRVIPYHAHQRARRTGQPPDRFLLVDRERHADTGDHPDPAP